MKRKKENNHKFQDLEPRLSFYFEDEEEENLIKKDTHIDEKLGETISEGITIKVKPANSILRGNSIKMNNPPIRKSDNKDRIKRHLEKMKERPYVRKSSINRDEKIESSVKILNIDTDKPISNKITDTNRSNTLYIVMPKRLSNALKVFENKKELNNFVNGKDTPYSDMTIYEASKLKELKISLSVEE